MELFPGAGDKAVPVKITVIRGNNLVGKECSLLNYVRAEFNGMVLGDSQKLDVAVDQGVDYNFTCSFECSDAVHTLDDVAHKPVILTVMEILPKEKKQKEEKTAILGQAVVDLLPLLHGQCSFSSTVILHPTTGSPVETAFQESSSKPSLDVVICVPEPLLSGLQLSDSNLLMVTVETAYSVPEVWLPASGSGAPSSYVAALPIPLTAEKEQVLMFSNGILKVGGEREAVGRPRKWPMRSLLAPGAHFIPGVFIEGEPTDMVYGDLTSIEDRDFRNDAETNKKRVCWDTERRCFLDAGGVACLTRRIAENRLLPVEVMRSLQVGVTKGGKAGKDKDLVISLLAVIGNILTNICFNSLLRTRRNVSILKESIGALPNQCRERAPSSVGSCKMAPSKVFDGSHKGSKESKESPKKVSMYADSRTYIIIEIALEKSLVPKRPPEELAKRVRELIPARPPFPHRPAGAERAVQEYQAQVASVVGQVLEQYQQLFGPAFEPGGVPLDPTTQEQRKTQLLGELNYSGKYFAFKEQMKYSVVRIVREKMLRTEAFSDPQQLQAFLSQLYVFLVDEMHVALNKTLSVDSQEAQPRPLLDCAQLLHFAKEAQLNQDYQLATQYYQERLSRDRANPAHWFDYGVFYMMTADYQKADECFHYALSFSSCTVLLVMSGVLAEMDGRKKDAETFFEGATCVDPSNVMAWTLFGEINSVNPAHKQASVSPPPPPPHTHTHVCFYNLMGPRKTKLHMAQRALAHEVLSPEGGLSSSYHLALARLHLLRAEYGSAEYNLKEALKDSFQDPDLWALYGHLHYLTGEYGKAQNCYERTLDFVTDTAETHPVFLRLGSIYLQNGEFEQAKTTYLRACISTPSCLTWLGLGIACYRLGQLTEAEDALTEANTLNNENAEVWGYLSLVCLQSGRRLEAEQSYKYALKLNLQEPVLCEIKALQDEVGFGNPCF
uniref:Cilia and flagella associated protein 70 n=1 Tax=Esox lucius TaxID=8010 RepID=A0A6Q2YY80_ESOLU